MAQNGDGIYSRSEFAHLLRHGSAGCAQHEALRIYVRTLNSLTAEREKVVIAIARAEKAEKERDEAKRPMSCRPCLHDRRTLVFAAGEDAAGKSLDSIYQCQTCGAVVHEYVYGGGQTSPNYPRIHPSPMTEPFLSICGQLIRAEKERDMERACAKENHDLRISITEEQERELMTTEAERDALRAALEETQTTIGGMIEQSLLRNVEPDASDLADLLVIIRAALKGTVTPLVTVHTCSCGLAYTAATWAALPLCGTQEDGEGGELELRHCPCGSTRSVQSSSPTTPSTAAPRASSEEEQS